MNFQLSEFNWQLVLIVVAISATVSYVGDVLGMKIGKRRISLFGLRPKYTSTVVTLLTGVGVALLTLAVASYVSVYVRGALLGSKIMERQNVQLNENLRALRDQLDDMELSAMQGRSELESIRSEKAQMESAVAQLREETEQLKRGLTEMKEGRVIAFQGELLAQIPIEGEIDRPSIDRTLRELTEAAEAYLAGKLRESGGSSAQPKVTISDEVRRALDEKLQTAKSRTVLRMTAPSNIVAGQAVEALVGVMESRLLYRSGEVLLSASIPGGQGQEQTVQLLYRQLKRINANAVAAGIQPNPITGEVGFADSIELYDVAERISERPQPTMAVFTASGDIYTEGPVAVAIHIEDE